MTAHDTTGAAGGGAGRVLSPSLFSSRRQDWETPAWLFDLLDAEFRFTLDATASDGNAKLASYYDEADDALVCPWPGRVFCNPPYGSGVGRWYAKAAAEAWEGRAEVVALLIPARTDTSYWHDYAMHADEIRFIRYRVVFHGAPYNAPFPSAVVVFRARRDVPRISTLARMAAS